MFLGRWFFPGVWTNGSGALAAGSLQDWYQNRVRNPRIACGPRDNR